MDQHAGPIVGIDLGTTNSLVAVACWPAPTDVPRVLAVDDAGGVLLPSVVRLSPQGRVEAVGAPAREQAERFPGRTVASVKRLMGRSLKDAARDAGFLAYDVVEGAGATARVRLPADEQGERRQVSPQEISAHVLAELKRRAEAALGVPVRRAVITVPAYFDDAQRQATRDAARLAGLEALRLVAEPTAAALAYGLGLRAAGIGAPAQGQVVAVYDLGGGTFDVSVLRISPLGIGDAGQADAGQVAGQGEEAFSVLATAGDTRLGGDDFDFAIVTWLVQRWARPDLLADAHARRALLSMAERAKIELSTSERALVPGWQGLPAAELTRQEFEGLIAPLVERTLASCRRAIKDAQRQLDGRAVESVILVGGATRTPLVRRRVGELFGRAPYTAIDPDCAVALGAAVQGAVLAGATRGALLLDVIPLSLGIETVGGAVAKVLMRNSTVPASASEMFSTSVDGQTSIKLHVLQGEREMASDCRSLGVFHLRGVPPMPAGLPQLRVEFEVDTSGVLTVRATELRSQTALSVQVVPNHGLTREEVARIEAESLASAREDMARHRVADLVANSRLDLVWIERQLARHGAGLPSAQREAIEQGARALREMTERASADWQSVVPDAFQQAKESLDRLSIPLHERAITRTLQGEGNDGSGDQGIEGKG
jgi:molecular chaperone HscA